MNLNAVESNTIHIYAAKYTPETTLRFYPGLHKLCQPASPAVGKWRKNEEMERDSLSIFYHFLFFFLPLFPFPLYKKLSHFVAKC